MGNNRWYSHIIHYHSATERNEVLMHAAIEMTGVHKRKLEHTYMKRKMIKIQ